MVTIEELEKEIQSEKKKLSDSARKKQLTNELNILKSPTKRNLREGLQRTGRGLKVIGKTLGRASVKVAKSAVEAERRQTKATKKATRNLTKARKKARRKVKSKIKKRKSPSRVSARTNDNDGFGFGGFDF